MSDPRPGTPHKRATSPPNRFVIPLTSAPSVPGSPSSSAQDEILHDYLARLAKREPRPVEQGVRVDEDGNRNGNEESGLGLELREEREEVEDKGKGKGKEKKEKEDGAASTSRFTDKVRRALVDWWSGYRPASASAASPTPIVEGGLDIDLSSIFRGAPPSSSSSSSSSLPKSKGTSLLLNYYSSERVIALLRTKGVLLALSKKGYTSPSLIFDTSDSFQHRLSLIDARLFESRELRDGERFLVDLFLKRREKWGLEEMGCVGVMKRVAKAGGWERLREMTGG